MKKKTRIVQYPAANSSTAIITPKDERSKQLTEMEGMNCTKVTAFRKAFGQVKLPVQNYFVGRKPGDIKDILPPVS